MVLLLFSTVLNHIIFFFFKAKINVYPSTETTIANIERDACMCMSCDVFRNISESKKLFYIMIAYGIMEDNLELGNVSI